jgi:hypothetical protein
MTQRVTKGFVRWVVPCVGLTVALVGAASGAAPAGDLNGAPERRHGRVEHSGWLWNGYRPDVYYSAPPVIYPSLGFGQEPDRKPASTLNNNFSIPLLWH